MLMKIAGIGAFTSGVLCLNSCLKVDDTYDLNKDFDMTITVGGDLTMPGSSTERMLLGDLLELEDDGIIKANEVTGDYALIQKGETSSTEIRLDNVEISNLRFKGFDVTKDFEIPVMGIPEDIDIPIEGQNIEIDIVEDNITEEILNVEKAFTFATNGKFTVNLNDTEIRGIIKEGYTITFPEYMTISSDDDFCTIDGGNVLRINRDVEFRSQLDVNVNILAVTFGRDEAEFDYANHRITLGGNVTVNGTITIPQQTVSSPVSYFRMSTGVSCDRLSLEKVNGSVRPKENKNLIQIGELPDFLNGDDVTLDMTDPKIYITLSNTTDADITLKATLKAIMNGAAGQTVNIDNLTIPANSENYMICIHQNRDFTVDGNEVIADGLGSLIEKIPDMIELEIKEVTATGGGVALGEDISIHTEYELNTPLMFGGNTNIRYVKTFDGWGADLDDAEFKEVEATMTVTNEIPLGINLTAEAIDSEGNRLENVRIDMDVDIEPGTIEMPSTKEIRISIVPAEGSIKGLDGINMTINARASDNTSKTALNENQTMQFNDIKLRLKGGVTIDLN